MDRRTILALVLCMLVFMIWSQFIMKKPPQKTGTATQAQPAQTAAPVDAAAKAASAEKAKKTAARKLAALFAPSFGIDPAALSYTHPKPRSGKIVTDALDIRWSNVGAGVTKISYIEKGENGEYVFKPESQENVPYVLTEALGSAAEESLLLSIPEATDPGLENMDAECWEVVGESENSVTFAWRASRGVEVIKELSVQPGSFHVNVELTFRRIADGNAGALDYEFRGAGGITRERFDNRLRAVAMKDDLSVKQLSADKLKRSGGGGGGCGCPISLSGKPGPGGMKLEMKHVVWTGIDNKYFCAFLWPTNLGNEEIMDPSVNSIYDADEKNFLKGKTNYAVALKRPFSLAPGAEEAHNYIFFVGPKNSGVLNVETYKNAHFGVIVDIDIENYPCCSFTGVGAIIGILAKLFLWMISVIYLVIPNYGVAIVILTIIIRLVLHPVSKRQQISMRKYGEKMKELQPEINRIKKKYKNNMKKQQTAQRDLMKKHGSGMLPLGGCLPMFLQLPVFIGLYRALDTSIMMRQAHFVSWINDLSRPDALVIFDPALPIIGQALNVLPLLMMAAMFVQQKIAPTTAATGSEDQQKQQKMMMYFMLIFFGFIFYNMPAGLNLYWFTSTLLGIFESRLINKQLAAQKAALE